MKKLKLFWPILVPFAFGIIAALISNEDGWKRYGVLIAVSLTFVVIVLADRFIIPAWWDRRYLPRLRSEFRPMLERLTVQAASDPTAYTTADSNGIDSFSSVGWPDGARSTLMVTERAGRCSVSYRVWSPGGTPQTYRFPKGIYGDIRIELWFRDAMERFLTVVKHAAAEDKHHMVEDLLSRAKRNLNRRLN